MYGKRRSMYASRPTFSSKRSGREVAVTVTHREFLQDVIVSDSDFQLLPNGGYALQPGNATTFPWLSTIAGQFTSYKCHRGRFDFVSTYGTAVGGPGTVTTTTATFTSPANAALGSISMAIQYDTVLPPWTTKTAMLSDTGSTSGRPSENQHINWAISKSHLVLDKLYVRTGQVPPNTDQRLFDLGTLYVSSDGMQIPFIIVDDVPIATPIKVGELWVDYSFTFYKPMIPTVPDDPVPVAPTAAISYLIDSATGIGWGGIQGQDTPLPGSKGAFGPCNVSGTQNTDQGLVYYPVLPNGEPNQPLIDSLNMPTFTGDVINFYPEGDATVGNQRTYRIDITWIFGTGLAQQIGFGAFNYASPRVPPPGGGALGDNALLTNNVFIGYESFNNLSSNDPTDGSNVVSEWTLGLVCWLIDPSKSGSIVAKYAGPPNLLWPPAPLTATGGDGAAYKANVLLDVSIIPNDLSIANYSGPKELGSVFKPGAMKRLSKVEKAHLPL